MQIELNENEIPEHLKRFFEPTAPEFKPKDLLGIPFRLAFALQADGWYLRSDIIWHTPNTMPESVTDRCTSAHEYVFMLAKAARYWYDQDAIREPHTRLWDESNGGNLQPVGDHKANGKMRERGGSYPLPHPSGRNKRDVWTIPTQPSPLPHYAMFPQALVEPMILAGCPARVCAVCGAPWERVTEREPMEIRRSGRAEKMGEFGRTCTSGTMVKPPSVKTLGFRPTCQCAAAHAPGVVCDPFAGLATTGIVAQRLGRDFVGCDVNADTVALANKRLYYRGDDRRMMREMEAGVMQRDMFAELPGEASAAPADDPAREAVAR